MNKTKLFSRTGYIKTKKIYSIMEKIFKKQTYSKDGGNMGENIFYDKWKKEKIALLKRIMNWAEILKSEVK